MRRVDVNKDETKCGKCNSIVKDDEKSLQCDVSILWYHITCINTAEQVYNYMVGQDEEWLLSWCCPHCAKGCTKMLQMIKQIEKH